MGKLYQKINFQPDNSHDNISTPPEMVIDNNLNENEKIKVIIEPSSDKSKLFIKAISKDL